MKKIAIVIITSLLLGLSAIAAADPVTIVFSCKLNDGKTREEAMAVNSKWLKWARATGGTDEITSSYVTAVIGDFDGFMWVDNYPDIATWGKIADGESGLDEAFDEVATCSGNRMYRGEQTEPAK